MIGIAFKSIQGVKSFAGGSKTDHVIPAKAGIQLNKLKKGGEAPFFTFKGRFAGKPAPTGEWRHQRSTRRTPHGYPVIPAKAGIHLNKHEKWGDAPFFAFQMPLC